MKLVNNNASSESDSGIGSSHHETSAEESPKKNKIKASTAVVTKLRRSPRSLAIQNRLDRISRGTSSTIVTSPSKGKGGRLKTTSFRRTPGFYEEWDRLDIFGYLCRWVLLYYKWKIIYVLISYLFFFYVTLIMNNYFKHIYNTFCIMFNTNISYQFLKISCLPK